LPGGLPGGLPGEVCRGIPGYAWVVSGVPRVARQCT
jgi:hypothetical protein